jgi:hypothetical protein
MIETMTSRVRPAATDVHAPTREARRLSTLLEVSQALSGTLNLRPRCTTSRSRPPPRGRPRDRVGAGPTASSDGGVDGLGDGLGRQLSCWGGITGRGPERQTDCRLCEPRPSFIAPRAWSSRIRN